MEALRKAQNADAESRGARVIEREIELDRESLAGSRSTEEYLIDVVADLWHYAKRGGLDPRDIGRIALDHWLTETAELGTY